MTAVYCTPCNSGTEVLCLNYGAKLNGGPDRLKLDKMKRTTTLKEIIRSADHRIAVIEEGPDFDAMSDVEIRIALSRRRLERVCLELAGREEKLFVNEVVYRMARTGNRIYKKREVRNLIYASGNSIRMKDHVPFIYIDHILSMFGIEWTRDMNDRLKEWAVRPSIFKAVITGRIYNEETLVKRIASQIYRIKNVEWKVLRRYLCTMYPYFSLYDINVFTKDFTSSLRVILEANEDQDYIRRSERLELIRDTLQNAAVLSRVINLKWSEKRMRNEHIRMVKEIMSLDEKGKSEEPIYGQTVEEEHISMLNSEKEVFLEGVSMSHCIYTNYYSRIKQGFYMAFHMTAPEECTIGVAVDGEGNPYLHQAYGIRNARCEETTYQMIREFVDRRREAIAGLLGEKRTALGVS